MSQEEENREEIKGEEENEMLKLKKETRCDIFAHGDIIPNSYKDSTWGYNTKFI